MTARKWTMLLLVLAALIWFARQAGALLVRDSPQKSDVILVLAGDIDDVRYKTGMKLLGDGYGKEMVVDAAADRTHFGHTFYDYAGRFVNEQSGELSNHISVCPTRENSTLAETVWAAKCLEHFNPKSVLLVTHDFHTRRALSIFTHRLPQYRWSVAGTGETYFFGVRWWEHREWAKTTLGEWQKLLWWELFERWSP